MSGAIVIEELNLIFLPGRSARTRLVVRGRSVVSDPKSADLKRRVELSSDICGAESEPPEEVFTVNGAVRPQIEIASGERQFWRVVNASADRYVDLQLEEQTFEIVAMDGMPIALHDPKHRTRSAEMSCCHRRVGLKPLSQVISRTARLLISRCVDTGPDGDPNPAMVLADIVPWSTANSLAKAAKSSLKPEFKTLDLAAAEKAPPRFTVTFTKTRTASTSMAKSSRLTTLRWCGQKWGRFSIGRS